MQMQDIIELVVVTLAGAAFTALKGTEFWSHLGQQKDARAWRYLEAGVSLAYRNYVRGIKEKRGGLDEAEAEFARNIALRAATSIAREKGDLAAMARQHPDELQALLARAVREAKAGQHTLFSEVIMDGQPLESVSDAVVGAGEVPPLVELGEAIASYSGVKALGTSPKILGSKLIPTVLVCASMAASTVLAGGCASTGGLFSTDSVSAEVLVEYMDEAQDAYAVWEVLGNEGTFRAQPRGILSQRDVDLRAYRYGSVFMGYAMARTYQDNPHLALAGILQEAGSATAWYVRTSHPDTSLSWPELRRQNEPKGEVPEVQKLVESLQLLKGLRAAR